MANQGAKNVAHGDIDIHALVNKVKQGNPAIALITNADGHYHWVIIDEVKDFNGINLLGIRDPGSGKVGFTSMVDFDVNYFSTPGVAAWTD